jgi:hypothetical protein
MQFRNLPSVDSVLDLPNVAAAAAAHSRQWVVELTREELDAARRRIRQGGEADGAEEIAALVCRRVEEAGRAEPRRVINATGVVIHTNLGRAPLSRAAMQAAEEAAAAEAARKVAEEAAAAEAARKAERKAEKRAAVEKRREEKRAAVEKRREEKRAAREAKLQRRAESKKAKSEKRAARAQQASG